MEQINQTMRSWEGAHQSDLIRAWGLPQQVFADGYGGQVFVYTNTRITGFTPPTSTTYTTGTANIYGNQIYGQATSQTVYNPGMVYGYTAYRVFFINKDGRIYSWSWKGLEP